MVGNGGLTGTNLNNSGETLRLVRPGGNVPQVTDVVVYRNGFEDPAWPQLSPDGPSIYMLPPTGYTATANDLPANWGKSLSGVDGAYQSSTSQTFNGFDYGSPGYLEDMQQGACKAAGPLRDGNGDGIVDLADLHHYVLCQYGPQASPPLNCGCFDADADEDVDLRDFDAFQRNINEPPPPVSDLLISEVVDGTLTNGEPKLIELTNCGNTAVDLADYRVALYANGSSSENFQSMVYGAMTGTLPAGASYVIANTNTGPGDSYFAVYASEPNLFHDVANCNGNDVYRLLRNDGVGGDVVVDGFGVRGVDGTGQPWEYLDSYASSDLGRLPNGGVFTTSGWTFGGPDFMDGFTASQIAAVTSAGTHTCD
jgi:hypothetical protein